MVNQFTVRNDGQDFLAHNGAFIDSDGNLANLVDILRTDFLVEVAIGNISNTSFMSKFGRNPDCDKASSVTAVPVGRDIWDLGIAGAAAWVPPTAARIHQLKSSNDEDGGAGTDTGALTIKVLGLDGAFAEQTETVVLDGVTNAPTANTYTMIYRMECLTFGSAGRNLGNIDATADVDGTVTARVTADFSQTQMAIYQVPAGKNGVIIHWGGDIHKQGGAAQLADVFLMSMRIGEGWRIRDSAEFTTAGRTGDTLPVNKFLEPKEYIKVVCDPSADGQDIGAKFAIVLRDI